jgi:hypothetical protein
MKIKTPIDFLTFNDGIVDIYETDEDDVIIRNSVNQFRFGNRTVGVKRYYAARQNDIELDLVIHIHKNLEIDSQNAAVINKTRYKIEQIQQMPDTNPPCTVLSLSQRGLFRGEDDGI